MPWAYGRHVCPHESRSDKMLSMRRWRAAQCCVAATFPGAVPEKAKVLFVPIRQQTAFALKNCFGHD